jgi:membrane-associated phospholipid phosphatase
MNSGIAYSCLITVTALVAATPDDAIEAAPCLTHRLTVRATEQPPAVAEEWVAPGGGEPIRRRYFDGQLTCPTGDAMSLVLTDSYVGDAGDFLLVNRFARRTGWLHGIMSGYAEYGLILFIALIALGWWLARARGDAARMAAVAWTGLGTLLAVAINQPIVHAVDEKRPYATLPHVLVLIGRTTDSAFPSDHATMAGAVATGLLFVSVRLGIAAWCAAFALAFARVYAGAHYPHDVVVGLALGAAVVLIGRVLAQPVLRAAIDRLARTRLRPVLAA